MSGVGDNGAGAPEMRDPGRPSRIAFDQGIPVPNAGRLPPLPPDAITQAPEIREREVPEPEAMTLEMLRGWHAGQARLQSDWGWPENAHGDAAACLTAAIAELTGLRANAGKAYCVYCGHLGTKADIAEHVATCEKHPLGRAVRELTAMKMERDRVLVERNRLRERVIDLEGICERALRWGLDGHERYSAEDSGRTGNDMRSLMTTKETPPDHE